MNKYVSLIAADLKNYWCGAGTKQMKIKYK